MRVSNFNVESSTVAIQRAAFASSRCSMACLMMGQASTSTLYGLQSMLRRKMLRYETLRKSEAVIPASIKRLWPDYHQRTRVKGQAN